MIYSRFSQTYQKRMNYASGNVYDDPRFEQGLFIYTTAILEEDKKNNTIKTASGSVYRLGQPHSNYIDLTNVQ